MASDTSDSLQGVLVAVAASFRTVSTKKLSPELLNFFTIACTEFTLNFAANGRLVNDVHGVFAPLRWHAELNALLLNAFKLGSGCRG